MAAILTSPHRSEPPFRPATDVLECVPYEQRLNQNSRWALSEGSLFFEDKGSVQQAMRRIAQRLEEIGVPYAIVGGMALFQHGFRRFTEDVHILVRQDGERP